MTEDNKPFTVKDRRHFTSEGETRPDVAAEESEAPPAARPAPPAVATSASRPAADPPAEAAGGLEDRQDPHEPQGSGFPRDFAGLLVTLGTQASMMLAGVEPGATEPGPPDLEGAKDVITLLESLQAKTEGHRTDDEERLLSGLLYELRMAWVGLRRGPGA